MRLLHWIWIWQDIDATKEDTAQINSESETVHTEVCGDVLVMPRTAVVAPSPSSACSCPPHVTGVLWPRCAE